MGIVIPLGPLKSWGSLTFNQNRSKMLSGWRMSAAPSRGSVIGQAASFDRYGKTQVPIEFTYTWEYIVAATTNLYEVQNWLNTFMAKYVASQVDTLTVVTTGSPLGTASGMARLDEVTETGGIPTFKTLNLTFFTTGLTQDAP